VPDGRVFRLRGVVPDNERRTGAAATPIRGPQAE
jgi:hypothetical protein